MISVAGSVYRPFSLPEVFFPFAIISLLNRYKVRQIVRILPKQSEEFVRNRGSADFPVRKAVQSAIFHPQTEVAERRMVGDPLLARRIKSLPVAAGNTVPSYRGPASATSPAPARPPRPTPGRRNPCPSRKPSPSRPSSENSPGGRTPSRCLRGSKSAESPPFLAAHVHRATVADRAERQRPVQQIAVVNRRPRHPQARQPPDPSVVPVVHESGHVIRMQDIVVDHDSVSIHIATAQDFVQSETIDLPFTAQILRCGVGRKLATRPTYRTNPSNADAPASSRRRSPESSSSTNFPRPCCPP